MSQWYITILVILNMPLYGTQLHEVLLAAMSTNAHNQEVYREFIALLIPMPSNQEIDLDYNALNREGDTALHLAAAGGSAGASKRIPYVKALARHKKVDCYLPNAQNRIPWEIACSEIKPLLTGRAPANFRHQMTGENFSHLYCRYAQFGDATEERELIRIFELCGQDAINQPDNRGIYPLHTAVANGSYPARLMCVVQLLRHGANPDVAHDGQTARRQLEAYLPGQPEHVRIMNQTKHALRQAEIKQECAAFLRRLATSLCCCSPTETTD